MVITVNGNPSYSSRLTNTTSHSDSVAEWQLSSEQATLYTIESMGIRFTRSGDGYRVIINDKETKYDICEYTNYASRQQDEPPIYLSIPSTYWENKTSGRLLLRFYSALYTQVYENIALEIVLKPKATISTGTADVVNVGATQTITLQNNALSQVSHIVTWQYGSVTGTVTTGLGVSTNTWAVPAASIATVCAQNPSGTIVAGTATIQTYFGNTQTESTLLGSSTINIQLNIPNSSDTQPVSTSTITFSRQSDSPQSGGKYFQHFTNVTVTPSATTKYGATLTSCQLVVINGGAQIFSQAIPTTGTTTFDHVAWPAGENTVKVVVTDSRGYSNAGSSTGDQTITLYAYNPPAITDVTVQRYDPSQQIVDDEGIAMQVTITASFDSTAQPAATNAYKAVVKEGSTTVAENSGTQNVLVVGSTSSPTSPEKTYDIVVTITDGYNVQTQVTVDIGTSTYTIYRMVGGKGVSFGKAADKYGVEVKEDWPFYTHGKEIEEMLLDYAHPVGSVIQTLDADFDPNVQWPWTQWGKLENVFLLGSGTRSVLDIGGSETQTDTFSLTIPSESVKLTANHLPKSSMIGYDNADRWTDQGGTVIANQRYGEANAPDGFKGRSYESTQRQHYQGDTTHQYKVFLKDDNDPITFGGQTVSASSTISTLPPYITVNIWVRAR